MKSSKILDFFQRQGSLVPCPACGISVMNSKLNAHLDSYCSSSGSSSKCPVNASDKCKVTCCVVKDQNSSESKPLESNPKFSRLSLKQQKKNCLNCHQSDNRIEVITLDDDSAKGASCDMKLKINQCGDSVCDTNEPCSTNQSLELFDSVKKEQADNILSANHKVLDDEKTHKTEIKTMKSNEETCNNSNDNLSEQKQSIQDVPEANACNSISNKCTSASKDSEFSAIINDAQELFDHKDNGVSEKAQEYEPYYIANFKHILNVVLTDEVYQILFNDEDRRFIKAFESSSDPAQKLYVRLFGRKYNWLRLNKICYPNITSDPNAFLQELVQNGLVDYSSNEIELKPALGLLSLPEAKTIAKEFNLNSNKSKPCIIQMLLNHSKEHKAVFFTGGKNSFSSRLLKRVRDILGPCYRISLLPKRLFTRILMLFSLPTMSADDDDAAGGQQQQLLTLLQVNRGELTFPSYKITRETLVFADRDELIRYEEAKQLENDIMNAAESRNFDSAKELYLNAKEIFEEHLSSSFAQRAESLPAFLKKFTSFHIYVRCMTQGVEILQKLRQYQEAVDLLRRLLRQQVFALDYHGRWWDRLALNLEQHLKKRNEALEAIKEAFVDKNVRVGYRHSLLTRALRLLKAVDNSDDFKKKVLEASDVIEAPKVVIQGRLCPRDIQGRRNVFISSSSLTEIEDVTVLGVEELAIEHYQSEGYTQGIHGEGSTFHSVYGLLFWDIIYDGSIPDAFISPYQNHPLDLNHGAFFKRRKAQILDQLEKLKTMSIEEIKNIVKSAWEAHCGQSSLVAWDRFTDVDHMLGLIGCMGNKLICGICKRLAQDFRFTRSGVPDLVVWDPDTLKIKIVEVKGPGDKLSSKQILWLDYLLRLGADAEVCHIEAVASKKLKKE